MYESTSNSTAEPTLRHVQLPRIRLHLAEQGSGPPVILLHGFPEFWFSWRHQLAALASAGFRAIAPDLRGYNLSDKPAGVKAYAIEELVADIVALIEAEAGGRTLLVGHDWGGVIAWRLAALRPDLVSRLAVLNAPHPARFRRVLWRSPSQWLKSWYVAAFQIPGLAEWAIGRRDFAAMDSAFRSGDGRLVVTAAEVERFKEALRQPGPLTAALNYYRAAFRNGRGFFTPPEEVKVPALLLWGERDPFLSSSLTVGLERWVPDLRVERLPAVGHWIQNEAADQVNAALISFFSANGR